MNGIENKFFEEYKAVEQICKDAYGENGVTAYINEMSEKSGRGAQLIADWHQTFKTLKHLRHLRNQIAHENGTCEVTQQDVEDVIIFHKELLNCQDPLAVFNRKSASRRTSERKEDIPQRECEENESNGENESGGLLTFLIATAVVVIVIAIAYFASR